MGLRIETDLKFTFEELKTDISFSDVNMSINITNLTFIKDQ